MVSILRLLKHVHATFSCVRKEPLAIPIYLTAICLVELGVLTTAVWADGPSITEAPAPTPKKHLRIASGITNVQYRQQLFGLTPLGSSYEQVKTFTKNELLKETYPSDSPFDGFTAFHHDQETINSQTRLINNSDRRVEFNRSYIREESPHAEIVPGRYGFTEGTAFTYTEYTAKPSLLGSWISLKVTYMYDSRRKLIDIYCFVGGRSITGP